MLGRLSLVCLAILASGTGAGRADAQPPAEHRVEGRVLLLEGGDTRSVPGVTVTLHRVGADSAGPLDSMRTGESGRYRFRYRPWGSEDALYFVSAMYGGIAYFSPPLRDPLVRGEDADIMVFDTTSAALPISVRGRHIVVSAARSDGARDVVEVYELSNDSSLTRIAPGGGEPVWSAIVPGSAEDFRMGQGDVSDGAVVLRDGRVLVYSPIAPGLRQISFSYRVPHSAFPLSVPLERTPDVLEILMEDPGGSAAGAGLTERDPVSAEGRTFRRFLAEGVPANAVASIAVPARAPSRRSMYVAVVALLVGAAMLIALAASFARRPLARATAPADDPEELARRAAALDAAFARLPSPSAEARESYEAERAELKARLSVALAGRGRRR